MNEALCLLVPDEALGRILQMNEIAPLYTAPMLTMSSREIAKLTGKLHRNVIPV